MSLHLYLLVRGHLHNLFFFAPAQSGSDRWDSPTTNPFSTNERLAGNPSGWSCISYKKTGDLPAFSPCEFAGQSLIGGDQISDSYGDLNPPNWVQRGHMFGPTQRSRALLICVDMFLFHHPSDQLIIQEIWKKLQASSNPSPVHPLFGIYFQIFISLMDPSLFPGYPKKNSGNSARLGPLLGLVSSLKWFGTWEGR